LQIINLFSFALKFIVKCRLQKNVETRKQQFRRWRELILSYAKHNNQAVININDESELFQNKKINRTLDRDSREMIMNELCDSKNAALVGKNTGTYEVYWLTLEEWSSVIYTWAVNCGMTNSVLTFFEILNGDDSKDQEFHQLSEQVFMRALKHLENKSKCEVIEMDGSFGVKFF
jgi:ESCRT-II complex subunit VPS25